MPKRYSKAEWQRFLRGRRVAVLGTVGADGTPLLTPIWYLYRKGQIWMRTDKESVKARNIARDPRVSVCVQDERPPYASVTVYGKASVEPAREGLGAEMAKHYLGAVGAARYQRAASEAIERGEEVTLVHAGAGADAGLLGGDALVRESLAGSEAGPAARALGPPEVDPSGSINGFRGSINGVFVCGNRLLFRFRV